MTDPFMAADSRGALWLAGEDVLGFLHRMTTAGLADLPIDGVRATLLLTEAGRAVDLLCVFVAVDGCLLVTTTREAAPVVAERLREHVLYGDKVRVTDASDQVGITSVWPARNVAVDSALDADPDSATRTGVTPAHDPNAAWLRLQWRGDEIWRLSEPTVGGSGAELLVAPRAASDALNAALLANGVAAADAPSVRVDHFLPAFGAEMGITDGGNPHELGLAGLVDDTKGCYVGQEVVARLVTYDRVQRALVQLRIPPGCRRGDQLTSPGAARRRPGRVTTVATYPPGLALAFATRPAAAGDHVVVKRPDGTDVGEAEVLAVAGSRKSGSSGDPTTPVV